MPKSNAASSGPDSGAHAPIALVGATATGKTAVGILLAEALGAEIVNCDSRQIYRRLDIGTAKPTASERARVPHHLVDFVDPRERYSAARYRDGAQGVFAACRAAGRPALLVGGTGLYLRAATEGLCATPAAAPGLRRWLETLGGSLPGGLHPLLARVDPAAAARIHAHDRYRIVRALEVFYLAGEPISERQRRHRAARRPDGPRILALDLPGEELQRRIGLRLEAMLEAGFVGEVRALLEEGLDPALPALRAVGYPEMFAHLRGGTTLDEAIAAIRHATWQYARRQLTWFRALPDVTWIPAGGGRAPEAIAGEILERLGRERVA